MKLINSAGQIIDLPEGTPVPAGFTVIAEPTTQPTAAPQGFGAMQASRDGEAFYTPGETYSLTTEEMAMPIKVTEVTHATYGNHLFLKVGEYQAVRLGSALENAIRESKRDLGSLNIDLKTVQGMSLNRTAKADASFRAKIFRATFNWS